MFSKADLHPLTDTDYEIYHNTVLGDTQDVLRFTDLRSDQVGVQRGYLYSASDDPGYTWRVDASQGSIRFYDKSDTNYDDGAIFQQFFDTNVVGSTANRIDHVVFADGVTWNYQDLKNMFLQATNGNDLMAGFAESETLSG